MEKDRKIVYVIVLVILTITGLSLFFSSENPTTGLVSSESYSGPFFQINLKIPQEYKEITPNTRLLTELSFKNIGDKQKRTDVVLKYSIKYSDDTETLLKSETVAVETEGSFVRYLDLPESIELGGYRISATLVYLDNKEAKSEDSFEVI